jgi:hypothetical protein
MDYWLWAALLKPWIGLVFMSLLIPLVMAFKHWFPDGKIKRFLLLPIPGGRSNTPKQS